MMRRLAAIVLAAGLLAAPALSQEGGERLYVLPPHGWQIGFHGRQGEIELTELVPPGQTIQDWSQMLTIQIISGEPNKTAQDIMNAQLERVRSECADAGAGPASPGVENGYETVIRAVACTRSKRYGKGELNLYKVLRGHERIYVVARSWRGEPFEKAHVPVPPETTMEWLNFMNRVVVCDSRDAKHPCPTAGPGPGKDKSGS